MGVSSMLVTLKYTYKAMARIYVINKFRTNLRPDGWGRLESVCRSAMYFHCPWTQFLTTQSRTEWEVADLALPTSLWQDTQHWGSAAWKNAAASALWRPGLYKCLRSIIQFHYPMSKKHTCCTLSVLGLPFTRSKLFWFCPGWWGSVDWVLACESKGCWFDSQSGHLSGFRTSS